MGKLQFTAPGTGLVSPGAAQHLPTGDGLNTLSLVNNIEKMEGTGKLWYTSPC